MTAEAIKFDPNCTGCGKPLQLDEMHYYEDPDRPGTATCNDCEGQWMADVDAYQRGELDEFPQRRSRG